MLLHLVKKDFLLVKKYLPLMMLLPIAIPLFVMWRVPELLGFGAFVISVIFTEFMLYQSVSLAEFKYPKAEALLCAVSYTRNEIVKARYVFLLLIFVYCSIAYEVLAVFVPKIEYLTMFNILTVLLISAILFGVYTPIQYKLGFERTKYFFSIIIIATPFVLPALMNSNISLDFKMFSALPPVIQYLGLTLLIIVILCVSVIVSSKIYVKKELL
ncbi:ABC-2 transporter permease [Bacillus sp. IITD106]|nr:ABC-2 transporter permease [Bacillus sp. IITD106]